MKYTEALDDEIVGVGVLARGAYLVLILLHFSTFSCISVHLAIRLKRAFKSLHPLLEADYGSCTLLDSNQRPPD